MLQTLLKIQTLPKRLDATDGLAAAVCHHFQSKGNFSTSTKGSNSWANFVKNNPKKIIKKP